MERRLTENTRYYISVGATLIALIISYATLYQRQTSSSKAVAEKTRQSSAAIDIQQQLILADISDIQTQLKVLGNSDDRNSSSINRIKDGLIVFATKEEVSAKFGNFSTTLKTDVMTSNSLIHNLNQRLSHLEGAWQQWNIGYYKSTPVLTGEVGNNFPTKNTIYDSSRYK